MPYTHTQHIAWRESVALEGFLVIRLKKTKTESLCENLFCGGGGF